MGVPLKVYFGQEWAELLNELLISLTKTRPRHPNDNALPAWVIRKWIGYGHTDKKHDNDLNKFYYGCFNEYINFHRPCAFPTDKEDSKGKIKKVYKHEDYRTPYEKLKSIPNTGKYLKEGVTFEGLDKIALRYTDNEMAEKGGYITPWRKRSCFI